MLRKIILSLITAITLSGCFGTKHPTKLYQTPQFNLTPPVYVQKYIPKYIYNDGKYTLTDNEFKKVLKNRLELVKFIKKTELYIITLKKYYNKK